MKHSQKITFNDGEIVITNVDDTILLDTVRGDGGGYRQDITPIVGLLIRALKRASQDATRELTNLEQEL